MSAQRWTWPLQHHWAARRGEEKQQKGKFGQMGVGTGWGCFHAHLPQWGSGGV